MRQGVEPVFDLARLFADGIKRAGVVGGVGPAGAAERGLRAQVVSCRPSDLSHGRVCAVGERVGGSFTLSRRGGGEYVHLSASFKPTNASPEEPPPVFV